METRSARGSARGALGLVVVLAACAGTVQSRHGDAPDGGSDGGMRGSDVGVGVNPDGADPFRPTDTGVIRVDGTVPADDGTWRIPDGAGVVDERYGYFYIGTYFAASVASTYVQAEFRLRPRPENPRCSYHGAGSWSVSDCEDTGQMLEDPHPRPFPHAGAVTITGGEETVTLRPMGSGQYTFYYVSRVVFPGPRELQVRAAGNTVPAFTTRVTVPPTLAVRSPVALPGEVLRLRRDRDLTVTWEPTPARSVYVTLTQVVDDGGRRRSLRLSVEFYGSEGRGTLPARALREFRANGDATLTMMPYNLSTQTVAGWPVQFTVVGLGQAFAYRVE